MSMSFPTFEFEELINTSWEQSEIREDFVDWKLMVFVFRDNNIGIPVFEKIVFWNIPNSIVDGQIRGMYELVAELVKNGNALYYDKNGKVRDNFPKEKRNSNGVCHVRPHAGKAIHVFSLPIVDKITRKTTYTKQCFWFNKSFVKKEILKNY